MDGAVDTQLLLGLKAEDRRGGELLGKRSDSKRRVGRLRIEVRETKRALVDWLSVTGDEDGTIEAGFDPGSTEELVDTRPENLGYASATCSATASQRIP